MTMDIRLLNYEPLPLPHIPGPSQVDHSYQVPQTNGLNNLGNLGNLGL